MAWYYPVIGSYSFTYLADAIVSGNDQLQNGSAYIDCYDYQGRQYYNIGPSTTCLLFVKDVTEVFFYYRTHFTVFIGPVVVQANRVQMRPSILKTRQWYYRQEKIVF